MFIFTLKFYLDFKLIFIFQFTLYQKKFDFSYMPKIIHKKKAPWKYNYSKNYTSQTKKKNPWNIYKIDFMSETFKIKSIDMPYLQQTNQQKK